MSRSLMFSLLLISMFLITGCGKSKDDSTDFEILQENGQTVLKKYVGSGKEIKIPDGVTEIGDEAFSVCTSMTSLVIPNGVTKIGSKAFWCCTSLTTVEIPGSVTKIGDSAFRDCNALTSVVIPEGVKKIGDRAFENCTALTSVKISKSVKEIGSGAFADCSALTSVEIPKSVTEIEKNVFQGCPYLTIQVAKGSRAEKYAKKNNIAYKVLEKKPPVSKNTEEVAATDAVAPSTVMPVAKQAPAETKKTETATKNSQAGNRKIRMTLDSFTLPAGFQLYSNKTMEDGGSIREYRNNNGEIITISDSFMYFLQSMSAVEAIFKEGRKPDAPPELKTMVEGAVNQDITLDGEALGGAILAPTKNGFLYYVLLGSDNNKDSRGVITIMVTAKSMLLPIAVYNMVKEGNYK